MCLTVNAYKLDTNDDFEKMSPYEQKNIFVDKRGTKLKRQKRQNIDILIVIATTYFLVDNEMQNSLSSRCSRELTAHHPRLCERPARAKSQPTCKFIRHHITLRRQIGISQLKSKHNLRNIFNQIYKLLYIRQIKFCYFSVTATEILSILFRLTQLRLKFILGKQTSQSGQ